MRSLSDLLKLGAVYRQVVETPEAPLSPPSAPPPAPDPAPLPLVPTVARPAFVAPPTGELATFPPPERWDDWVEYESKAWPKKEPRRYMLVPTTCFNCEAGCGLLAYVD